MVEMELVGVRVELPSNVPIVVLREKEGDRRVLPIFIGVALDGVEPPRPLTHDLVVLLLEDLSVSLERVLVTELRDSVFFAELHLRAPDGVHVVSCRPSDAIAVAVRVGAPLFASDEVLADAGHVPAEEVEEVEPEDVVEQFREFIESVDPDDFAS
jgi:hypothetical protein